MSRTVNGEMLFDTREKEVLRKMIRQVADFSGVEVLTFCLMDNHFHVLVRVHQNEAVSDAELMRRYGVLYPKPTKYQAANAKVMEQLLALGGDRAEKIRERLLARMYDVSEFMKTLKQRFSTWFNATHSRFGPLWSDRFKSVLVEPRGEALRTVAAYIDLNPVRAGLVADPKDYRFCGYAEAVAGEMWAKLGLHRVARSYAEESLASVLESYRMLLFGKGSGPAPGAARIDREAALRVIEKEKGALPTWVLLRCRLGFLTDGAILGSREFLAAHYAGWQKRSGRKRPTKIRPVPGCGPQGMAVIHNFRRADVS